MKLQYHKIRGVDKSVCTAEQKIAYNMASRIYGDIRFAKVWQQYDSGKVPAFLQNDWESKAIRTYFTTWQRDYNKASAHYNEDAIFSALRAGLHDFICHHGPIFTSYREIAKNFTAPCYVVTWPIIRPSAENEEDACDWSAPNGLTPHGEYDLERRYYY